MDARTIILRQAGSVAAFVLEDACRNQRQDGNGKRLVVSCMYFVSTSRYAAFRVTSKLGMVVVIGPCGRAFFF